MGAGTKIEWADHTVNFWMGCEPVSPGCANCYARRFWGMHKMAEGERRRVSEATIDKVLRQAEPGNKIFVNSLSDFFDPKVSDGWRMYGFRRMNGMPWLKFLLLTKRAKAMAEWIARWSDVEEDDPRPQLASGPEAVRKAHTSGRAAMFADFLESMGTPPEGCAYPFYDWAGGMRWCPKALRHVWLGVTAENQATADERVPELLAIDWPGKKFVSIEPMLGPVDLVQACGQCDDCEADEVGERRILDPEHDLHPDQTGDLPEHEKPTAACSTAAPGKKSRRMSWRRQREGKDLAPWIRIQGL